ncbi:MAG: site-specific integrase [Candidatus Dormibacteraeota bacterium]|nr:site-specific integrase [Candidatus Dormibacteraeota bacterium]
MARLKLPEGGGWRYFYGKDRAAAKARLTAALRADEDGRPLPDQRQTFGAHLEQWVNSLPAASIKPSTCRYYTRYVRYHLLTSDLARKPLARLEPADLRRLYADKLASGLSSTSVHHLHATIHVALNQALDDGKVVRNVAALVGRSNRPRVRSREMTTIAGGDQPARFLEAARGERLEALMVLAITSGMRQGELRALRWKDVDLNRGVLAVTGSVTGTTRAAMTIGTPKSGKTRSVALGAVTVAALREHRRRQIEEQLLIGSERKDRGLVFCAELGEFLPTNTMVLLLHRVLARAGLPRIRFHDLRHTAATLMLANGVHPKIVSEMLGHSTTAITLDLYSHVTPHMQQSAAATMDRAITAPPITGAS